MPVDNSKILKDSVDKSMYRYPYENRELVDMEGNLIRRFSSISDAMRESGITVSTISYACKSKSHIARGYLWKLAEKNIE